MNEILFELLIALITGLALIVVVALVAGVGLVYVERKVLADLQIRLGPMRVGPHGMLQTVADMLKMMTKEDTIPGYADKPLFWLAPVMVLVPAFLSYLVIPISPTLVVLDWDIGIFWIFAVTTITPVGIIVAGWASYNKFSLLGGLRSAAQQISYEVPLLLAVLGVIMLSSSLNLGEIVAQQQKPLFGIFHSWFIFLQPLGFLLYLIAGLAELNRTPFDIPEAESELVSGYNTEYSGMKFGIFMLAEYSNIVVIALLGALLFLGGWDGPSWGFFALVPVPFWLLLKTAAIIYLIIWIRGTFPRVRIDQLMNLGWKIMLPLTLANVLVTGLVQVLAKDYFAGR